MTIDNSLAVRSIPIAVRPRTPRRIDSATYFRAPLACAPIKLSGAPSTWHLRLGFASQIGDEQAFFRRSGRDRRTLPPTSLDVFITGERELRLAARALMASQALPGQNGLQLPVEADGLLSAAKHNKEREKQQ